MYICMCVTPVAENKILQILVLICHNNKSHDKSTHAWVVCNFGKRQPGMSIHFGMEVAAADVWLTLSRNLVRVNGSISGTNTC